MAKATTKSAASSLSPPKKRSTQRGKARILSVVQAQADVPALRWVRARRVIRVVNTPATVIGLQVNWLELKLMKLKLDAEVGAVNPNLEKTDVDDELIQSPKLKMGINPLPAKLLVLADVALSHKDLIPYEL